MKRKRFFVFASSKAKVAQRMVVRERNRIAVSIQNF